MCCLASTNHDLTHHSDAGSVTRLALPVYSDAATACRSLGVVFADAAFSVTS